MLRTFCRIYILVMLQYYDTYVSPLLLNLLLRLFFKGKLTNMVSYAFRCPCYFSTFACRFLRCSLLNCSGTASFADFCRRSCFHQFVTAFFISTTSVNHNGSTLTKFCHYVHPFDSFEIIVYHKRLTFIQNYFFCKTKFLKYSYASNRPILFFRQNSIIFSVFTICPRS